MKKYFIDFLRMLQYTFTTILSVFVLIFAVLFALFLISHTQTATANPLKEMQCVFMAEKHPYNTFITKEVVRETGLIMLTIDWDIPLLADFVEEKVNERNDEMFIQFKSRAWKVSCEDRNTNMNDPYMFKKRVKNVIIHVYLRNTVFCGPVMYHEPGKRSAKCI